jgi:hypothetical protein
MLRRQIEGYVDGGCPSCYVPIRFLRIGHICKTVRDLEKPDCAAWGNKCIDICSRESEVKK